MRERIIKKLEEEIWETVTYSRTLVRGSEEHKAATEHLTALYKITVENEKIQMDFMAKQEQAQQVIDLKKMELAEQKKDRWFRVGTAVGVLVIELSFYGVFSYVGFKYEETGTINSSTFKGLINRFKFTKV